MSPPLIDPSPSREHFAGIQAWLSTPAGQMLLERERLVLDEQLARHFGGFLVHYGYQIEAVPSATQIQRNVRLGPPLAGSEIVCDEQAWPLCEHAADVVVLQHALDFAQSPHGLLREAAQSVRPGGHLLVVGLNPWSGWGVGSLFSHEPLGLARCISAGRVADWLSLLGFALEKRCSGCYRPPLSSPRWQQRLAWLEGLGTRCRAPGAGFYVLIARKMVVGLRPLPQGRREPMGKLIPMPVAKVSRRHSEQ